MSSLPVDVLLVEDDEVDVRAVQRAFRKQALTNTLHVARDGVEALRMLRGDESTPAVPSPRLILLDLNLPRMDGHAFLAEVRKDPELRESLVFVLTTSEDALDVRKAYEQNVAGYVLKSRVGENFRSLLSLLLPYLEVVEAQTSGKGRRTAESGRTEES